MFKIENLENIIAQNKDEFFVTLGCPNYEERSIFCLSNIVDYALRHKTSALIKCELLFLKGRKNNNLVLEELKLQYKNLIKDKLDEIKIANSNSWHKIDYPNNFNSRGLITRLSHRLKKHSTEKEICLHIDISAMPREIVFSLCEAISSWLENNIFNIKNVYFSYVAPERYSQLPYAQEVGLLRGFFTGEPITVEGQQDIRTVIFPNMTGHESKLLLDELSQIAHEQKNAIFSQIDADDFLTSMEIMRANQILMEQGDSTQYYYCSLYDAQKELLNYFKKEEKERKSISPESKRLYLVAPFGSKIMLPISFFVLKKLKEADTTDRLDIEICHAQGFQYTSVYSIGAGKIYTFSLDIKEWKQK